MPDGLLDGAGFQDVSAQVRYVLAADFATGYTEQRPAFTMAALDDLMLRLEEDYRSGEHLRRAAAFDQANRTWIEAVLKRRSTDIRWAGVV